MSFKKVLCPIDFSPGSQHALGVAARMTRELDAELALVHAWNIPPRPFAEENPIPEDMVRQLVDDEQRRLLAAVGDATELGAPRVTSRLLHGVPWDQITQVVRDDPAVDLIVMGTHGRTGLARIFLGSVTEQVIRHAPCSVLAVRGQGGLATFKNVLCPIDFSDESSHVLDRAAELARQGGAGITLLHVIEPGGTFSGLRLPETGLHEIDRQATLELKRCAATLAQNGSVSVKTKIRLGSPPAHILSVLDADPTFDLVIVGSRGSTGIRRILVGSVAEKVVRHAACPVLIVRPRR